MNQSFISFNDFFCHFECSFTKELCSALYILYFSSLFFGSISASAQEPAIFILWYSLKSGLLSSFSTTITTTEPHHNVCIYSRYLPRFVQFPPPSLKGSISLTLIAVPEKYWMKFWKRGEMFVVSWNPFTPLHSTPTKQDEGVNVGIDTLLRGLFNSYHLSFFIFQTGNTHHSMGINYVLVFWHFETYKILHPTFWQPLPATNV